MITVNRVVVTGIGIISGVGNGIDENWSKMLNGETGIDFVKNAYDVNDSVVKLAAEVKNFNFENYQIDKKELKKMSKNILYAVCSAKMAVEDSGYNINLLNNYDVGVFVSSGIGGLEIVEKNLQKMFSGETKRFSPYILPTMLSNMAAANISILFGAKGPARSVNTACATGNSSIGDAYEMIKNGKLKAAFAGACESCISKFLVESFNGMHAISLSDKIENISVPFSKNRNGFTIGEGAAILFLENLESARQRNAKIYAEIIGYAETSDAHHITSPNEDGKSLAKAIEFALKDAGIKSFEVDYINAHGTATKLNDAAETKAIKEVFGGHAKNIFVNSIKSYVGHTLGAAGAIEAAILAKSLESGKILPIFNLTQENIDEDCDLKHVINKYVDLDINIGISNSMGFGGHNSVLVMKKFIY